MRLPRLSDETGSSLTEFAIIAPLLILLVIWSQFFTDLGIFKLKLDEASRYAVWEMAAQRQPGEVQTEIQNKFKNLYSPDDKVPTHPYGVESFKSVTVTGVSIDDHIAAPFKGRIQNPAPGGGGLASVVMSFFTGLLNRAVDAILGIYGFNMDGEAEAKTITFQAPNTLFPGADIGWLAFHMNDSAPPTITMTTRSAPLLVDTWKAWPGKYTGETVDTSPSETYGTPGAPETEVANRMQKVAFFGVMQLPVVGQILGALDTVLGWLQLPIPFLESTWNDNSGPVAMWPGDKPRHSWEPGGDMHVQRGGDDYDRDDQSLFANIDSPDPGIDRARSTTPAAIHTDYWKPPAGSFGFGDTNDGGFEGFATGTKNSVKWGSTGTQNPYVKEYKCRDAWYMGGSTGQVQHWGKDLRSWAQALTPQCP